MYQQNLSSNLFYLINTTSISAVEAEVTGNNQELWSFFRIFSSPPFFNEVTQNATTDIIIGKSKDEINSSELIMNLLWEALFKLRFLFYLVWPTETMFSSLQQVPRYVTEVSK